MKCPICSTKTKEDDLRSCGTCGWKFERYFGVGEAEKAAYAERVAIARKNWRELQELRALKREREQRPKPLPKPDPPPRREPEPPPRPRPAPSPQPSGGGNRRFLLIAALVVLVPAIGLTLFSGEDPEPEPVSTPAPRPSSETPVVPRPEPIPEETAKTPEPQESRYSTRTKVPSLKRDPFETVAEFENRINTYPPVPAGTGRLIRERYDIQTGAFPFQTDWDSWTGSLAILVRPGELLVEVDRDTARQIYEEGPEHPLFVTLNAEGETVGAGAVELFAEDQAFAADAEWARQSSTAGRIAGQIMNGPLGMKFAWIPPGTFMMGSPEDEPGRYPNERQHQVTLTGGYWLQTTEVTQGQWKAVMGSNPSKFKNCGDNCPVEEVSWNEVQEFIKKLNVRGVGTYRLPTEAQWEYAARAGTDTPFNSGNCLSAEKVNYDGNYPISGCSKGRYRKTTTPVGSLNAPNGWGLHGMHGNVWEWVADWYGEYPSGSVTDPAGPESGAIRVIRGGSWDSRARSCRAANRYRSTPGSRYDDLGFRLLAER